MNGVTVTRVGTQVVVRLSGPVDDRGGRLDAALCEVADLVLGRVVVDLTDAGAISDTGLDFLVTVQDRWRVRLIDPPAGLRQRLDRHRERVVEVERHRSSDVGRAPI